MLRALTLEEMSTASGGFGEDSGGLTSNQESGCEIIGGIVGGTLGLIAGSAMTVVSGPITGGAMGIVVGAGSVTSATNACEDVVRDWNDDPNDPEPPNINGY